MEDVQASTAALQAENGVSFFGRELRIEYAKEVSDQIAKRDGIYVSKAKRIKTSSDNNADTEKTVEQSELTDDEDEDEEDTGPSAPPSQILLVRQVPDQVTHSTLQNLFQPYSGFREVRTPRPGLAFIDFESEPHATLALQALQGFQFQTAEGIVQGRLRLEYGKT
jgi:RNA recognition motif-containing protein